MKATLLRIGGCAVDFVFFWGCVIEMAILRLISLLLGRRRLDQEM